VKECDIPDRISLAGMGVFRVAGFWILILC
jgi:hypothetical protein